MFKYFLMHHFVSSQCDLLDMPAVGQLEKDGKYALVYQLMKIFLTQRLDAYLDFHAANSTLLKSYGKFFGSILKIVCVCPPNSYFFDSGPRELFVSIFIFLPVIGIGIYLDFIIFLSVYKVDAILSNYFYR